MRIRKKDIPKLLYQFVKITKDGYLGISKSPKYLFGLCGDSFALFDIENGDVIFCNDKL